ncbi:MULTISPECIES: hypothetical protein [unclassified Desulfovibrio]|uniref:hypothetical protein n=1 Tax=unclassified Desulfovibrio TaxID=2593640 RepID=UPI002FD9E318
MPEQTVSFSVDASLLNAFAHVAEKNACDNTELLRAFMAEYVQQDARRSQYDMWFKGKVERGLRELKEGRGLTQEQALAQMGAFKSSLTADRDGYL